MATYMTTSQWAQNLREEYPGEFDNWEDRSVANFFLKRHPQAAQYLTDYDTPQTSISSSDPADLKFTAYQFKEMVSGIPAWAVGTAAQLSQRAAYHDTLLDYSETLRERAKERTAKWLEDPEILGYLKWIENEPITFKNFWKPKMMQRGLAQAIPSMATMIATDVALGFATAGVATPFTMLKRGKKFLDVYKGIRKAEKGYEAISKVSKGVRAAGTMGTMGALEASDMYNSTMSYLVDEKGVDSAQANAVATSSAAIYGVLAGIEEYIPFHLFKKSFKTLVGVTDNIGKDILLKQISNKLGKLGAWKSGKMITQKMIAQAMTESSQEWVQYMTQAFIEHSHKVEYGDVPEEKMDYLLQQAFSPEAIESAYSGGIMGGLMGSGAGVGSVTKKGRVQAAMAEIDSRVKAGDITEEEGTKIKAEVVLTDLIKEKEAEAKPEEPLIQPTDEELPTTVPPLDEREIIALDDDRDTIDNKFLSHIANPRVPFEISSEIEDKGKKETVQYIKYLSEDRSTPNKFRLLKFLTDNKEDGLQKILNHSDSNRLTLVALKGILDGGAFRGLKININKYTPKEREKLLRLFAKKGKISQKEAVGALEGVAGPQAQFENLKAAEEALIMQNQNINIESPEYVTWREGAVAEPDITPVAKPKVEPKAKAPTVEPTVTTGEPSKEPTAAQMKELKAKPKAPVKPKKKAKVEKKAGETLVETKTDRKGRTFTYFSKTKTEQYEGADFKTTTFTFNRSDKSKDQRNKAGVSVEAALGNKYQIKEADVPEGSTVTKVFEIRDSKAGVGATVEFTIADGRKFRGEIGLKKKEAPAKAEKKVKAKPKKKVKAKAKVEKKVAKKEAPAKAEVIKPTRTTKREKEEVGKEDEKGKTVAEIRAARRARIEEDAGKKVPVKAPKEGDVVKYNDKHYILWNVNKAGKAQLISPTGKKFTGTPMLDKLTPTGQSLPKTTYNNVEYVVDKNNRIFSLATGKEVFKDPSAKVRKEIIKAVKPTEAPVEVEKTKEVEVVTKDPRYEEFEDKYQALWGVSRETRPIKDDIILMDGKEYHIFKVSDAGAEMAKTIQKESLVAAEEGISGIEDIMSEEEYEESGLYQLFNLQEVGAKDPDVIFDMPINKLVEKGFTKVGRFEDGKRTGLIKVEAPVEEAEIAFEEDPSSGYRDRTRRNASADATIAIAINFESAGERLTKSEVLRQNKEYISIDAKSLKVTPERVDKIVDTLNSVNAKTLNIAGNGIYTMKGTYTQAEVDAFTYELLKAVVNHPNLKNKIESVRTGGQTGFDEAGAKASQRLGIPTKILAPKGWKFRNIDGKDISNEAAFKARFEQISKDEEVPTEPSTGDIVEYNGKEWYLRGINSSGFAQLTDLETGKNFPGTPKPNKLIFVKKAPALTFMKLREKAAGKVPTKEVPSIEKPYKWARTAPVKESYEVSTKGDKRFSALVAKLSDGRTIEEHYQVDVKGYSSVKKGKGKPPKDTTIDTYAEYKKLWQQWADENPALIDELAEKAKGKTLTDMFATTDVSQARALAEILNEREEAPMKFTPENITSLKPNQVFVFGSNLAGIHGKGAALTAKNKFGAIQGTGEGIQGQSYALPTKDENINSLFASEIEDNIDTFINYAKNNPDKEFLVTKVGTRLAGFTIEEIGDMFRKKDIPQNVILPKEFSIVKAKDLPVPGAPEEKVEGVLEDDNIEQFDDILEMRDEKIDYTEDQRSALGRVVDRLFNVASSKFFVLSGYAGTGKTTIIENIVKYAQKSGIGNVYVSSFTGKAVARLREVGEEHYEPSEFNTLHGLLYGEKDKVTNKWVRRDDLFEKGDIIIIDEASMVSGEEQEFLDYINDGIVPEEKTGKDKNILNDLILSVLEKGAKIIFVGDKFQLPPVGKPKRIIDKITGKFRFVNRFDPKILDNMNIKEGVWDRAELSQVVRQGLVSSILKYVTALRYANSFEKKQLFMPRESKGDVTISKNLFSEFFEDLKKGIDAIAIVGMNATRIKRNIQARAALYGEKRKALENGEQLIAVSNGARHKNGEIFKADNVSNLRKIKLTHRKWNDDIGAFQEVIYKYKVGEKVYDDVFIATVDTKRKDGKKQDIILLPYLEGSSFARQTISAKGLPGGYISEFEGRASLKSEVDIVTYGYVVTGHKSQGSEWDNVYIGELLTAGETPRWLYTAATRAKSKLIFSNSLTNRIVGKSWDQIQEQVDNSQGPKETEDKKSEYQQIDTKKAPIAENKRVAGVIIKRLKKLYPKINARAIEKVFDEEGHEVAGRAIDDIVEWSTTKGTLDTIPHEYAHIYINLLEGTTIMRDALNDIMEKFELSKREAKEYLAEAMGLGFVKLASRSAFEIKSTRIKSRLRYWAKRFWFNLRKMFRNPVSQRKWIAHSVEAKINRLVWNFYLGRNRDAIRFKPKVGFVRINLERALEMNSHATNILKKIGDFFILAGSAALAPQGPIYRESNNLFHDLDLISQTSTKQGAQVLQENYPDAVRIYNFWTPENQNTQSFIVPEEGATVIDIEKNKYRRLISYKVIDKDGEVIGSYNAEVKRNVIVNEIKKGKSGILVDIFANRDDREPAIKYKSKTLGKSIDLNSAEDIFKAKRKINMFKTFPRDKDIIDHNIFYGIDDRNIVSYSKVTSQEEDPDDPSTGESNEDLNTMEDSWSVADSLMHSFFQKEYGVRIALKDYGRLVDLAIGIDDFDKFAVEMNEFIRANYEDAKYPETRKEKKNLDRWLRNFWQRQGSKIPQYHEEDSPQGRYSLEVEVTTIFIKGLDNDISLKTKQKGEISKEEQVKFAKEKNIEVVEEDLTRNELSTGNKIKDNEFSTFVEEDGLADTVYLSLKDIVNRLSAQGKIFWNKYNGSIDDKFLRKLLNNNPNLVFVGVKGGTESSLLFAKMTDNQRDMTDQEVDDYWDNEIELGNITDEIWDFLYDQIGRGNASQERYTKFFREQMVKHEWWKNVRYPQYLQGTHIGSESETTMSVQDHYDRMKIDFTSTFTLRGAGKSSIMTVNSDTSVILDKDGNKVDDVKNYDGWILSSGTWFSKIGKILGFEDLSVIKGVIRSRFDNGNNEVDYIGTKGLQMKPFNGMKIAVENEQGGYDIIAEYKGRGRAGKWKDAAGNTFDHLSPTDTSKMTNGKYTRFNEIHELPEGYQKVIQMPKQKDGVAFPVTVGELLMDSELLKTEEGKELHEALSNYYNTTRDRYLGDLVEMIKNPEALRDELYKHIDENDILPELQRIVDVVGEEGKGLQHPSIAPMWIKSLFNKFIKRGLLKLRSRDKGVSTGLYYKPFYAPDFIVGKKQIDFKDDDFSVSSQNRVVLNYVEKAYFEKEGEKKWLNDAEKIEVLNKWLLEKNKDGNYKNNVKVLLSRQPINKMTGVVIRNVRHLKTGEHGQVIFLSYKDVIEVFDGDWDGDSGFIVTEENKELFDAFSKFQKSEVFEKKNKVVDLKLWGKQFTNSLLYNPNHIRMVVNNIAMTGGAIGLIQNARITLLSMNYKNFKLKFSNGDVVTTFNPTDRVMMDYKALDTKNITEEMFKQATDQGDKFFSKDGKEIKTHKELGETEQKVFLETTKEHEMSTILQMAVDEPKFALLGAINMDNEFLIRRMFKLETGKPLDGTHIRFLVKYKKAFNFSPFRQGLDGNNKKFDIQGMLDMSSNLTQYKNKEYPEELLKGINNEIREKDQNSLLGKVYPVEASFNFKETPQEILLIALEKIMNKENVNPSKINEETGQPITNLKKLPFTWAYHYEKMAHLLATLKMVGTFVGVQRVREAKDKKYKRYSQEEVRVAKKFAEDFSKEFYPMISKNAKERNIDALADEFNFSIDYNEKLEPLINKFLPRWEKMSDREQMITTLIALRGTQVQGIKGIKDRTLAVYRIKALFPTVFMHPKMHKEYLKLWYDNMISDDLKRSWKNKGKKEIYQPLFSELEKNARPYEKSKEKISDDNKKNVCVRGAS